MNGYRSEVWPMDNVAASGRRPFGTTQKKKNFQTPLTPKTRHVTDRNADAHLAALSLPLSHF
jgi:hypothetical protein